LGHGTFITSPSVFVSVNVVLKRYVAGRTFSKHQPYSKHNCLSKRTYTYRIDADKPAQLRLWSALYRDQCCEKGICEITAENNARGQLSSFYIV